ncbi:MAG: methyltransferase, partial [Chloroflexi bacterium]
EHSRRHAQKPGYLIVLSARTADQLRQQAEQLVAFCERNADGDCGNMSHTLLLGRKHLSHRLACVVRDHKELETLLRKWLEKGRVPQVSVSNLENRELREDASLKRYGNQCIQDCRQSAGTVGKRTGAVETAFTPVHSLTPETYLELLVTVAELYVQGYTLAFEQLFVGEEYSRISLPTYPFARERYWIPSLSVGVSSHGSESTPRLRSQSLSAPVNDPSGDTLTLVPVREAIAVASVPSVVHSLQRRIPDQKEYIKSVQGEVGQKLQEMDKMLGRVLWVQLQTCGWFTKPQIAIADLKAQVGLPTRYNRWLNETITVFAQRKYLSYDVHSDTVADPISIDSNQAWREWEQQKTVWLADPDLLAWAVLVETSLRALPEVLAGRVPATDILFPHASMELVEGIYKDNRLADLFNGVLADVVVAYLHERSALDEAVRLRILEIGAGTGGTSALIFQKLLPYQEYIQEYCYTDLSQAFLWHAQQAYGPQNPYLTYRIFNVEKPIADQGMSPGSYDIVVATNVLHATRSLRQTLRNAKALLKRHGLLLINELTHKSLLLHVAFGLLDGWWLHEDQALRLPGCPFLTPDRWQVVLEQEGFQQLFFPTAKTDQLDQQIIVAENDGIVRQPHTQQADRVSHQNVEAIKQRSQSQSERRVDGQERRESARLLSNQPIQSQSPHIPIDALRQELSHIVSHLLNVPIEEISAETALSEYGFDSISFTGFARRLNQTYELDLAPPLFYEYSTIERLAQYLQTTYASVLVPHFTGESLEIVPRKDLTSDTVSPSEASSTVEVSPITTHVSGQQLRIAHSQTNSLEQEQPTTVVPIAIIGVSGSFPQAPDVQSLWDNLLEGKDCISEIPPSRWDWRTYFGNPEASPNKTNVKWAGVIEDIEQFDPLFFGISPSEAEQMDPQQRLLMMYVWKAIEDAGYKASSLSGTNTALFVGTANSGYGERISRANGAIEGYFSTGQAQSIGPNRMSYFLNLHGPSEMIDTACSSSLVAIHRGVSVIESGVCSMAIVGGVNTLVSPNTHISLSKTGMLSPDGRCKTFSVEANGFVRSEGVGILVLKKLSDAEQSGDHIYGVIRGSAENHGGRASSLTAPNPRAQADLLIAAYRKAGIDPRTVNYIEAHGTGTELGDPIEINGLKTAWNELMTDFTGNEEAWCGIGSVKSNIGHLELAAGVTGVIKVLLQMQHKKLVKSLHCEQINPYIKLKGSPFYIMQETRDWEAQRDHAGNILPRRAGVSSF